MNLLGLNNLQGQLGSLQAPPATDDDDDGVDDAAPGVNVFLRPDAADADLVLVVDVDDDDDDDDDEAGVGVCADAVAVVENDADDGFVGV